MTSRAEIPSVLTDDERLVVTAVFDLSSPESRIDGRLGRPVSVDEVVAHLRVYGRFGVARASRALSMLAARGLVRRTRPKGSPFLYEHVRWPTREERG